MTYRIESTTVLKASVKPFVYFYVLLVLHNINLTKKGSLFNLCLDKIIFKFASKNNIWDNAYRKKQYSGHIFLLFCLFINTRKLVTA